MDALHAKQLYIAIAGLLWIISLLGAFIVGYINGRKDADI